MLTDDDTMLHRAENILSAPMEDRLLILSIEQESYFELSPVTMRIWELLETPHTMASLVDSLLQEYEVNRDVCRDEVREVIDRLLKQQLLRIG